MANFHDGFLDTKSELGKLTATVQLTADNQVIVLFPGQGVLYLVSDNTTAANRTFTISAGSVEGQMLRIILTSAASTTCELLNTGNVKLSAAWTPLLNDNLALYFDGTNWIEVARVDVA